MDGNTSRLVSKVTGIYDVLLGIVGEYLAARHRFWQPFSGQSVDNINTPPLPWTDKYFPPYIWYSPYRHHATGLYTIEEAPECKVQIRGPYQNWCVGIAWIGSRRCDWHDSVQSVARCMLYVDHIGVCCCTYSPIEKSANDAAADRTFDFEKKITITPIPVRLTEPKEDDSTTSTTSRTSTTSVRVSLGVHATVFFRNDSWETPEFEIDVTDSPLHPVLHLCKPFVQISQRPQALCFAQFVDSQ